MTSELEQKLTERTEYCRRNNIILSFDPIYKDLVMEALQEPMSKVAEETERTLQEMRDKAKNQTK